ncbi:uncharacterized protein LOC123550413 [Mercenaria mercenaria]|uniref:uncharacterized protein LOC123550413 n=1 Tax=Mercenaria mercenaria TaxID=6596 RepID=UPI00234E9DA3|nr:uncharacterized protein LOC123550413 [Mercenaria mercenaria]
MPSRDEQNDGRPPNRPWLTVSLFLSCLTGLVLQVLSFAYLFQGLCNNVPADRAYCMNSTNNTGKLDNETTDKPEGVPYYRGYQVFIGLALFTEILVIVKLSSKIECCVKLFVTPRCAEFWECCLSCGNCWYIMDGISVILNLLGIISVCMGIPFSDMIYYIVGFRLGFGNLLFGFIKLTAWTIYSIYRRSCCPDSEYFLWSSRRLSETFTIETTAVIITSTETRKAI